jgi:hypothetical protein
MQKKIIKKEYCFLTLFFHNLFLLKLNGSLLFINEQGSITSASYSVSSEECEKSNEERVKLEHINGITISQVANALKEPIIFSRENLA